MRWARPGALLALVCTVALASAWLGLRPDRQELPSGSSYSTQPDGAKALYVWAESLGARAERLSQAPGSDGQPPRVIAVVQPDRAMQRAERALYDTLARRGTTVVVAGDTFSARALAESLGVTVEPTQVVDSATLPNANAAVATAARARVRADDATPLLLAPNGDWLALRKPYGQGEVVVFATSYPLTNEGLRDPGNARLVYRSVVAPALGQRLALDESHHGYAPPTEAAASASFGELLLDTAPGRAIVYAACLLFVYLLLAGRRLGPPLPFASSQRANRTMFEHIQTVAALYRRAHQLEYLRAQYREHYTRRLRRALGVPGEGAVEPDVVTARLRQRGLSVARCAQLRAGMVGIAESRSDGQLLAAVASVEAAIGDTAGLL